MRIILLIFQYTSTNLASETTLKIVSATKRDKRHIQKMFF